MTTNSKCDPTDYMTRVDCDRFHDAKTEHYGEIIRESREDRKKIHDDLELLESRIIGRQYFDTHMALLEEKLKPVFETVAEFKSLKWWLVKIAFVICLIVGGGMFFSYHYGNNTKAMLANKVEIISEKQIKHEKISETNCKILRALAPKVGVSVDGTCDGDR